MLKKWMPHSVFYVCLSTSSLLSSTPYSNDSRPQAYPSSSSHFQPFQPSEDNRRTVESMTGYWEGREAMGYGYPNEGSYDNRRYSPTSSYGQDSTLADRDPFKLRSWDWNYKESWREDKDTFYRGGNQTNALQKDFYYQRPPGIGDPDEALWLDPQYYRRGPTYGDPQAYYYYRRPYRSSNQFYDGTRRDNDINPWNDYPNPYYSRPNSNSLNYYNQRYYYQNPDYYRSY